MAVGVKLLHIVSDYNPQVCIVPFSNVAVTKVYQFLVVLFVLGKRFFCWPQLPEQYVEYMMSCPALSVSQISLKH